MVDIKYKIPREKDDYPENSKFVVKQISQIIETAIKTGNNKIFIHTNLRKGLPLENINKVAGPFVEAWALEQFEIIGDDEGNQYQLINIEPGKRLDLFDIILQFKRKRISTDYLSANIDVKATAEDIKTSGKSPNITSFARIRSEYIDDPDYIFIVLSLKYKVYSEKDQSIGITKGTMEIVSYSVYDLKYISEKDLNYNPSLGTGQLQIRDIHYVDLHHRTTWEFLQMLDKKFIRSQGKEAWLRLAKHHKWIKE
jgi:hypothetical protein